MAVDAAKGSASRGAAHPCAECVTAKDGKIIYSRFVFDPAPFDAARQGWELNWHIRALDVRLKFTGTQIAALVTASGPGLTGLDGIGPVIAGRILVEVGYVARFATKDKFASYKRRAA